MRFLNTLERDEDGVWIAECPSISGCGSQGQTRQEALTDIREPIAAFLEVRADRSMPLTIKTQQLEVPSNGSPTHTQWARNHRDFRQGRLANGAAARQPHDPRQRRPYPVLSSAIKEYYKVSEDGANAWVMRNLETLDPATSQRIVSVVAQEANRNMEFETSRQWANRILNPEVRKQLLDQVDQREEERDNGLGR